MDRDKGIYLVSGSLILLGALILYGLLFLVDGFVAEESRQTVNIELIKLVTNSLIVGGAGLLFYKLKSASDEFGEDQKIKTAFVETIIENYNRAKSVRRRIRFANVSEIDSELRFDGAALDKLLLELNDVQLSLETSKRVARANPRFLRPHASQIEKRLEQMEKFLGKVIKSSVGKFDQIAITEKNGGKLYQFVRAGGGQNRMVEAELFSQMDGIIAELN